MAFVLRPTFGRRPGCGTAGNRWPSAHCCCWQPGWCSAKRSVTSSSTSMIISTSIKIRTLPAVQARGDPLVVHAQPLRQLAPADVDLAYAGLPALWAQRRRVSPDQRSAARRHCNPAVSRAAANDGVTVAERLGGRAIRGPSDASRVRRLGDGTQGRSERIVLRADARGIFRLCASPVFHFPISGGGGALCLGAHGQGYVGDAAVRAALVGLLAARPPGSGAGSTRSGFRRQTAAGSFAADSRESPSVRSGGRLLRGNALDPGEVFVRPTNTSRCRGGSATPQFRTSSTLGPFAIRRDWRFCIPRRAPMECSGRFRPPASFWRASRPRPFWAGDVTRTCWLAGSGIWECWCR